MGLRAMMHDAAPTNGATGCSSRRVDALNVINENIQQWVNSSLTTLVRGYRETEERGKLGCIVIYVIMGP